MATANSCVGHDRLPIVVTPGPKQQNRTIWLAMLEWRTGFTLGTNWRLLKMHQGDVEHELVRDTDGSVRDEEPDATLIATSSSAMVNRPRPQGAESKQPPNQNMPGCPTIEISATRREWEHRNHTGNSTRLTMRMGKEEAALPS